MYTYVRREATTKVVIKPQPHSQPQTSRCYLLSATSPDQKSYARLGAEGPEFPQTSIFQMVVVVYEKRFVSETTKKAIVGGD